VEQDRETLAHIAGCSSCAALLAELEADRALLRELPVPDMRVRLPRRRPVVWPWAAAAAVLAGMWFWPRTEPVQTLAYRPPSPAAPEVRVAPGQPEPPRAAREVRAPRVIRQPAATGLAEALEAALPPSVNPPAAAAGEVVIAMKTEDPDVIIVLVGGDSNE
jgi:hypothetical protein